MASDRPDPCGASCESAFPPPDDERSQPVNHASEPVPPLGAAPIPPSTYEPEGDVVTQPKHPADGPAQADRCTFCAHPRLLCEQWVERTQKPCCVKCSHGAAGGASSQDEKQVGIIGKYHVERVSDPEGKHADCWYFVLDPIHDPLAHDALYAYATAAAKAGYHVLAYDIRERLRAASGAS